MIMSLSEKNKTVIVIMIVGGFLLGHAPSRFEHQTDVPSVHLPISWSFVIMC